MIPGAARVQHKLSSSLMICMGLSVCAFTLAEQEPAVGVLVTLFAFAGWYFNERLVVHSCRDGAGNIAKTTNITNAAVMLPTAMPRWLSTSLLVVATALSGVRGYVEREAVSAFMWLLASVLLLKLWEKRDLRDYGQMLTVSVFLTVGATLGSTSVLLGVVLLAQIPAVVSAVMWYQLRSSQVRGGGLAFAGSQPASKPKNETLLAQKEYVQSNISNDTPDPVSVSTIKRNLWKMRLFALIGGGTIAVGAFIVVPRGVGWQQLGEFGQPQGRSTGFTDVIDLDQSGLISESYQPVLTVELRDGRGKFFDNPPATLYLRGVALDQYSGREWRAGQSVSVEPVTVDPLDPASSNNVIDRSITRRATPGAPDVEITPSATRRTSPESGRILVQKVTVRQFARGEAPIFAAWRPRRVQLPGGGDIRVDALTLAMTRRSDSGQMQYTVTSWESTQTDTPRSMVREDGSHSPVSLSARQVAPWNRWRRGDVTFPSVKVQEAAQSVLEDANISYDPSVRTQEQDIQAARALATYVQRICTYTLDIPAAPLKDDPIEFFLFASRRGHCELFASALAALCRSVGIDARVVAGYAASEYDAQTGTYVVRQSDAHAWCEVNVAPGQWVTIDGVPSDSAAALRAAQLSWYTPVERFFADVRDKWNNSVIMFDSGSQQRLLGGSDPERPWYFSFAQRMNRAVQQWQRDDADRSTRDEPTSSRWILWTVSIVLASIIVAAVWLFYRLHKKRELAQRPGWGATSIAAMRLAAELDRYFVRIGKPRAAHTPLRTHAQLVTLPAQVPIVMRSIDVLYLASFSGADSKPDFTLLRREIRSL